LQLITSDDRLEKGHGFMVLRFERLIGDKGFIDKVMFSDEELFFISGEVSRHISCICSLKVPSKHHKHE
jgi:hypothetical protein